MVTLDAEARTKLACAALTWLAFACDPISLGHPATDGPGDSDSSSGDASPRFGNGSDASTDASNGSGGAGGGGGTGSVDSTAGAPSGIWKDIEQLYAPLGSGHGAANAVDLEIGATGAPYFSPSAFQEDPFSRLRPLVQRYIDIGWLVVGEATAPEPTTDQHRMLVSGAVGDETVHLLLDGSVVTFAENAWGTPSVPAASVLGGERMTFEQDTAGTLYTVTAEAGLMSVARFDAGDWEPLGPDVPLGSNTLSPLVVAGDQLYLNQSITTGIVVHAYDGNAWDVAAEVPGELAVAYAGGPDGALYVASRPAPPEVIVRRWHAGSWTDVTTISSHYFAMHSAHNGALAMVHGDAEGRLNLVHWRDGELSEPIQAPAEARTPSQYLQLRVGPEQVDAPVYITYLGDGSLPKIWMYEYE